MLAGAYGAATLPPSPHSVLCKTLEDIRLKTTKASISEDLILTGLKKAIHKALSADISLIQISQALQSFATQHMPVPNQEPPASFEA